MKILIIGKTGQLGSTLVSDAALAGHAVFAPSKEELNIADEKSFLKNIEEFLPDIVINTAAFHNVLLCETEAAKAFQFNCLAVRKMAEISDYYNSWFASFSTDYVFDGNGDVPYEESVAPKPLQMYGLSKLAGEYAALSYSRKSIIIRTSGLYGLRGAVSKGGNFVDNRIKDSERNTQLEISDDQTVSPTYAGDLSRAVLKLIEHPAKDRGIYHLVNEGFCTWYEFTKETFDILKINVKLIPVDRNGKTADMKRPLFSALKNKKAAELDITLPPWRDGLYDYLRYKYPSFF